jgi:mRNA interferase MazF
VASTIRLAITVQKTLLDQAQTLARQFNISRSRLFSTAMAYFLQHCRGQALLDAIDNLTEEPLALDEPSRLLSQEATRTAQIGAERKPIHQGDIYWVPLEEANGTSGDYTHPHVVLQDDLLNHSRIGTVVVCALTSNMKRAKAPGNVLLEPGEANLTRQSVVVVSQVSSVEKTQLGEYIGSLTEQRIHQIFAGMQFLQSMVESRKAKKGNKIDEHLPDPPRME